MLSKQVKVRIACNKRIRRRKLIFKRGNALFAKFKVVDYSDLVLSLVSQYGTKGHDNNSDWLEAANREAHNQSCEFAGVPYTTLPDDLVVAIEAERVRLEAEEKLAADLQQRMIDSEARRHSTFSSLLD